MEPRDDKREQRPAPERPKQPKPKRFRLVRLEERIAPAASGGGTPTLERGYTSTTNHNETLVRDRARKVKPKKG
jgi:hypothetical protein